MYEVQLIDGQRPIHVDAESLYVCDDPGRSEANIRLLKDEKIVFFAPFDCVLYVQKVELCSAGTTQTK
jgi:hypothetical protein